MKKFIALALIAVFALSFAACGGNAGGNGTSDTTANETKGPSSALELLETVWKKYPSDDRFAAVGGSEKHMKDDAPGKYDLDDAEVVDSVLGFPQADIAEIDDAASLMHMMNQNTFTCGAYHVKDSANVQSLAEKIKENILDRHWMCGFPEKLVIVSVGDYLVVYFGDGELVNTFTSLLTSSFDNAAQISDTPIE